MSDIGIFAGVVVMQLLDKIAPMAGTLPVDVIGWVLDAARFPFLRDTQKQLLARIEKVVDKVRQGYTKDTLVITGHSLGGAFAEVSGARLRIPAVGFSAPGQYFLMKSFGLQRQ